MKIEFKLNTSKMKAKGHPLVLNIYNSIYDRIYPFTGFYSKPDDWNFDAEMPKASHPDYALISNFLLEKRLEINRLKSLGTKLSAEQIKNRILGGGSDLYSFWEELIKEKYSANEKFYRGVISAFKKYRKALDFKDIDYNFIVGFKNSGKVNCSDNGMSVYLRTLRTVYNEGIRRGLYIPQTNISPFHKVINSSTKTKDKYISIEEVKKIFSIENPTRYDLYFQLQFLLGGVDFIDIAKLETSHIRNGRIRFERFKGGTREVIDNRIFPETKAVIDKLQTGSYLTDIHKLSFDTARENFNKRYRIRLNKLGIESYFSSKSARYTFINIGRQLLLNREVVMELTGHSRGSKDIHAIYEGKLSERIKDDVHRKIIDAVLESPKVKSRREKIKNSLKAIKAKTASPDNTPEQ